MNDLDLYDGGGALAPYAPSPTLDTEIQPYDHGEPSRSPTSLLQRDDRWGDGLLFGAPMPPGTTPQQVQIILGELGALYLADFTKLGYPNQLINSAITFLMNIATKPARQVTSRHGFKLPSELKDDWLANLFGNYLSTLSGTHEQKAQFLTASIQWLDRLNRRLNTQQLGTQPAQGSAPQTSDPTENLTDQQYQQLVTHNNAVMAKTLATLERRWGACYKANIELAQAQLAKMTPTELAHLDRWTGAWPWTHMFNTVECLTAMYDMAIGANSIGTDGASIAQEIAAFESMLKIPSERQKYMRDPQMQARLRELYARRGN